MDFQILGPLEVRREGQPVPLGAAKLRALLAILLLHAGEVVSSERLIDGIWGDEPPGTASHALQVYVAQLRKALEPGHARGAPHRRVLTRAGGYLLHVEPGRLDAERFERLVAEGRRALDRGEPAAAATELREALALWRGPALADFTYAPFAQGEIARLEELRLVALDGRLEADLALGAHARLVGELESLVREHPLRERLRGQLMLALYRSGRQADALAAFQDARRTLVDELGIEPGPGLQGLQRDILEHRPGLDAPLAAPAQPARREPGARFAETRRIVTVLIAAWSGPAADLDPEVGRAPDERFVAIASETIERHGGSVQSVLGREVMAVFGVPHVHEDDALRALRAALELSADVELRVGVASGEVVAAEVNARLSTYAGAPAELAAELEDAASAGEILLSESTLELAGRSARAAHARRASGSVAYRLLGLVPQPSPLARPLHTAIVGRETELAQLRQAFERVAAVQSLHLCTILGHAGIGKSRLVQELCADVSDRATVLAGRCVPYGEGITFWPLVEIAGQVAAAGPISELLAGEEGAELIAGRVADASGVGEATSSREELFLAFRRLFAALALQRPLVVVFDDLHWAEPTLLDFIEYLAESARDAPIMLVCLARLELLETRPSWAGGKRNASSLVLERLPDADADALIGNLASGIPDATRARVREAAEGNPLFLEQLVATVAEQPRTGALAIPPTIQALLAARLDRLGPGERAVIERAAVVGREFREGALVDLLPESARPFTERHLEALVGKDLVSPVRSPPSGGRAFRFRHVLIQQAAYRGMSKRLRGTLHERFADWLERDAGSGSAERSGIVGYHLEQAFRYGEELGTLGAHGRELAARAADRLASAGRRAFRRGDMPASAGLLARAATLLPSDDPARLELLPDLGFALFEVGEFGRAADVLTEAVAKGRAGGRRGVEWRASVKRAHLSMFTEPERVDAKSLCRHAERAVRVLDELGDDAGLAKAWLLLAEGRVVMGRLREACDAADHAAEHARRAGSHREQAWALGEYAWSLIHGLTPVADALREIERRLDQARGNPLAEANLPAWLAMCEAMAGRFDDGRARIRRSRALTRDLGLTWQAAVQDLLRGRIELLAGDPVAAETHLRASYQAFHELGDRWLRETVAVHLAGALHAHQRDDDAFALTEAFGESPGPGDLECEIKAREVRARILARRERVAEAEHVAREAVAIAADTEFLEFHADALMALAEILDLAGRTSAAMPPAEEALRLYERKGIVSAVAEARAPPGLLRPAGGAGGPRASGRAPRDARHT
jgi:DNA-binding SARP family transcriptional activator